MITVTLAKSVLTPLKIAERDILRLIRLVICTRVNWEAEVNVELAKLKPALSKYIASWPLVLRMGIAGARTLRKCRLGSNGKF